MKHADAQQKQQQQYQEPSRPQQQQHQQQQPKQDTQGLPAQQPELPSIVFSASPRSHGTTPKQTAAVGRDFSLPDLAMHRTESMPLASNHASSSKGRMHSPHARASTSQLPPATNRAPTPAGTVEQSAAGAAPRRASLTSLHTPTAAADGSNTHQSASALSPALGNWPEQHLTASRGPKQQGRSPASEQQHQNLSSSVDMGNRPQHMDLGGRSIGISSKRQEPPFSSGQAMLTASVAAALKSSLLVGAAPQDSMLTSAVFHDFTREVAARIIQHYWRAYAVRQHSRWQTEHSPRQVLQRETGVAEVLQIQIAKDVVQQAQHDDQGISVQQSADAAFERRQQQQAQPDDSCTSVQQSADAAAAGHRRKLDCKAEEPMHELLLRYRGPESSKFQANSATDTYAVPSGHHKHKQPLPAGHAVHEQPLPAGHAVHSSQRMVADDAVDGASSHLHGQSSPAGHAAEVSQQMTALHTADSASSDQHMTATPVMHHMASNVTLVPKGLASNDSCSADYVLRASSASLDRLKHRHAATRRPKPTATQAIGVAGHSSSGSSTVPTVRCPAALLARQSSTMSASNSAVGLQSSHDGINGYQPQLSATQTTHCLVSTAPQHRQKLQQHQQQPVVVPPPKPFEDARPALPAGHRPQQTGAAGLLLSVENSDAALLHLLNPPNRSSNSAGQQLFSTSAVQSHAALECASQDRQGAEENWGENCSPNISPEIGAHKPPSKHMATFNSAVPNVQSTSFAHKLTAGSTDRQAGASALASGLGVSQGTSVQQNVHQLSSEKLADIFAFLDGVEAQVGLHCSRMCHALKLLSALKITVTLAMQSTMLLSIKSCAP